MNLEEREQQFLIIGAVLLCFFVLLNFGYFPAAADRLRLERAIPKRRQAVVEMRSLADRYAQNNAKMQQILDNIQFKSRNFNMLSQLEKIAQGAGINKRSIDYMNPTTRIISDDFSEDIIEIKLVNTQLAAVTRFLYNTEEKIPKVYLKSLQVTQDQQLNVTFKVGITYRRKHL